MFLLPTLQNCRIKHLRHSIADGRQQVRPCDIKLTCKLNRRSGGMPACTRSISRGEHDLSARVARTQLKRRQIRQQFESTGNMLRPSEYIMTQRAVFLPTPGSDIRYSSHSMSAIARNGANV